MASENYLQKIRQDLVFTETLPGHSRRLHITWGVDSAKEIDECRHLWRKHIDVHEDYNCRQTQPYADSRGAAES